MLKYAVRLQERENMSYSKEKREWYLTLEGWKEGDFYYDTGGVTRGSVPDVFVAKYEYIEEFSSAFDKNPILKVSCIEIIDEKLHDELLKRFGNCPRNL